jgi:hypothetical protein
LSSVNEELPNTPVVPDIPPHTSPSIPPIIPNTNITPEIPKNPKPIDKNQENIPPKDTSKFSLPNRETLPIYRPFNRTVPINDTNQQYQKRFDAVTGRYVDILN